MSSIKAVVKNGRIVVDEPTDLPDGTLVELHASVEYALTSEELERLDAHMHRCAKEEAAGRFRPMAEFLADLRSSR